MSGNYVYWAIIFVFALIFAHVSIKIKEWWAVLALSIIAAMAGAFMVEYV